MDFKKSINILLILLIFFISLNIAFASDNVTDDASFELDSVGEELNLDEEVTEISDNSSLKTNTQIQINEINSYYKEKNQLVGYLKDTNGVPIENKTLNIFLNGKVYNRTTDLNGKVTLDINLKPNAYNASVKFSEDNDFISSQANTQVKIKKAPLKIKISDFNTYENSDIFFKAKVYNKITNNAVAGIRITFKVYSLKTKKYAYYHATTNKKGIAELNKNLKVGSYKVSAQIKDSKNEKYISYGDSKKQVKMKVKPTAEWGCCSFYLQVSNNESVAGFRRDATNALNIYIKSVNWHGRTAIKQYKTSNSYFFHSITTSDGWMVGTGGIDNPSINKAIENLAGEMVKSNSIKKSTLKKIQYYEQRLGLGHFSIKAPDGKFAVVWGGGYRTGKLNPGEYFSCPNLASYYRHSTYGKFGSNLITAAIKVGATDSFGVNRRDITVFHWKATTSKYFKTTSSVDVYASNDNGKLVGRSTAYLKDNIYFKNKYFSKNSLPQSTNKKFLGTHNFGNIDKLIKTPTIINAPSVTNQFNTTKYFKITVKNQKTKKAISGLKIKVRMSSQNMSKTVLIKTDSNGIVKINTKQLKIGDYEVLIRPTNNKYLISASSKIIIKE